MRTKIDRQLVYDKFNGKCAYCGCQLIKGWHIDHLEAVWRSKPYMKDENGNRIWDKDKHEYKTISIMERPENHTIDNCMPACASCNLYKSANDLESFRKSIQDQPRKLRASSPMIRLSERYGIITIIEKPIVFYFETLYQELNDAKN